MSVLKNLYETLKAKSDNQFQRLDISHSKINDCDWLNHIYTSPSIRYGHLEYFKSHNDAIEVVHSVFFPSYYKALPIFGFDVISLGGKVSGIFCDYTPAPYHDIVLQNKIITIKDKFTNLLRPLPEWINFMSPDFLMISPKDSYPKVEESCIELFDLYIKFTLIFDSNNKFLNWKETLLHIQGQNRYSLGQRKNQKTQKALAKYVGEEESLRFIENVLFPVNNYSS